MVTTPNTLSQEDVLKSVKFARQMYNNKMGLVENMAYYICPNCGEKLNIFGKMREKFSKELEIDFWRNSTC